MACDSEGTAGNAGTPSATGSRAGYEVGRVQAMGGGDQRCVWENLAGDPFRGLAFNKKRQEMKNVFELNQYPAGLTTPTARHLLPGGGRSASRLELDFWPEERGNRIKGTIL